MSEFLHLPPLHQYALQPKGKSYPIIEIDLATYESEWLHSVGAMWSTGGFGGPLGFDPQYKAWKTFYPSRESALEAAIAEMRRRIPILKDTKPHHDWLDMIEQNELVQKDLFA